MLYSNHTCNYFTTSNCLSVLRQLDGDGRPALQCLRVPCPALTCLESQSVQQPGSCCKTCPRQDYKSSPNVLNEDLAVDRSHERKKQLLSEGGCTVKVSSCCQREAAE